MKTKKQLRQRSKMKLSVQKDDYHLVFSNFFFQLVAHLRISEKKLWGKKYFCENNIFKNVYEKVRLGIQWGEIKEKVQFKSLQVVCMNVCLCLMYIGIYEITFLMICGPTY